MAMLTHPRYPRIALHPTYLWYQNICMINNLIHTIHKDFLVSVDFTQSHTPYSNLQGLGCGGLGSWSFLPSISTSGIKGAIFTPSNPSSLYLPTVPPPHPPTYDTTLPHHPPPPLSCYIVIFFKIRFYSI